jgi:hypothetical protein
MTKLESRRDFFLRISRLVVIIGLIITLIVVVIGLILGWPELRDYGFALILAGVAAWMIGGASMMGTLSLGGDAKYQYARTFSPSSTLDRMRQDAKDRTAGGSFLMLMFAVGIVVIVLGLALMALGGPPPA